MSEAQKLIQSMTWHYNLLLKDALDVIKNDLKNVLVAVINFFFKSW